MFKSDYTNLRLILINMLKFRPHLKCTKPRLKYYFFYPWKWGIPANKN